VSNIYQFTFVIFFAFWLDRRSPVFRNPLLPLIVIFSPFVVFHWLQFLLYSFKPGQLRTTENVPNADGLGMYMRELHSIASQHNQLCPLVWYDAICCFVPVDSRQSRDLEPVVTVSERHIFDIQMFEELYLFPPRRRASSCPRVDVLSLLRKLE
jgi:hypothetical protein